MNDFLNKYRTTAVVFPRAMHQFLGRSMIEMLGVLAIIGVLSIGGLYAYRQAMIRYRTNQALSVVQCSQFVWQDLCGGTSRCPFQEMYANLSTYLNYNSQIYCAHGIEDACALKIGTQRFIYDRNRLIFYQYENGHLPAEICAAIVLQNWENIGYIRVALDDIEYGDENGRLTVTQRQNLANKCLTDYKNNPDKKYDFVIHWKAL